jgi:hypothetical protein
MSRCINLSDLYLRDWCIWLVDLFECMMMRGFTNPKHIFLFHYTEICGRTAHWVSQYVVLPCLHLYETVRVFWLSPHCHLSRLSCKTTFSILSPPVSTSMFLFFSLSLLDHSVLWNEAMLKITMLSAPSTQTFKVSCCLHLQNRRWR